MALQYKLTLYYFVKLSVLLYYNTLTVITKSCCQKPKQFPAYYFRNLLDFFIQNISQETIIWTTAIFICITNTSKFDLSCRSAALISRLPYKNRYSIESLATLWVEKSRVEGLYSFDVMMSIIDISAFNSGYLIIRSHSPFDVPATDHCMNAFTFSANKVQSTGTWRLLHKFRSTRRTRFRDPCDWLWLILNIKFEWNEYKLSIYII